MTVEYLYFFVKPTDERYNNYYCKKGALIKRFDLYIYSTYKIISFPIWVHLILKMFCGDFIGEGWTYISRVLELEYFLFLANSQAHNRGDFAAVVHVKVFTFLPPPFVALITTWTLIPMRHSTSPKKFTVVILSPANSVARDNVQIS